MVIDQATHEAIEYILTRGVVQVEKEAELRRLLNTGKPLRIKLGVEPSHYDLTIGHAVVFRKLRQFQRLGHKAVVVIGDWTARLGDPSEREDARKPLTAEQVKDHAATYLEQFFRIVDPELTEVRWQSEWYNNFDLGDAVKLQSHKTVAQMLARDDFSKRYKSGVEIYLSEFMYPLLQGYDSVALHADVKKMGKSLSNYIAMTAPASDMYGKLMSLPDYAMMSYFETLTDVPQAELDMFKRRIAEGSLNPRDVKMRMAREIVSEFHNPGEAQEAEESFVRQFSERELPTNIPEFQLEKPIDIVTLMVDAKLVKSKGEARRLIQQGGVSLFHDRKVSEAQRINDIDFIVPIQDGMVLKVGKFQYIRIKM